MSVNNREIKFRAWDTFSKRFHLVSHSFHTVATLPYAWARVGRKKNQIIWQQFTGLFDKNNKEIYEGDILLETMTEEMVANGSSCSIDEVRFNCGAFLLDCEPLYNYISSVKPDILEGFEIIGNIFENPELLK